MILVLVCVIPLLLFTFGWFCKTIKYTLFYWLLALPFVVWFWLFMHSTGLVDHIEYIKPVNVGNIKVVSFKHDGNIELINLNERFFQQISDYSVIKLTLYKSGPYYWLYSPVTPIKIELVEAIPQGEEDAEL